MATKKAFLPVGDNLLVSAEMGERTTEAGLVIPTENEMIIHGKVMCRGPGKLSLTGIRTDCLSEAGDEVYFGKINASTITLENKKYFIVSETNILGIVTEVEQGE